jgi:two-component system cell cycle sensor histidine kinase/response regulator CckA
VSSASTEHHDASELIRSLAPDVGDAAFVAEALLRAHGDFGDGVAVVEGERMIYANEALARMYGYTVEELLAMRSFLALVAPEHRNRLSERLRERAAGKAPPERDELTVVRKDGARIAVEYIQRVVRLPDREQTLVVIRDVTEQRATGGALRLHSAIVSAMSEGVCLVRVADATIAYTNPKFDRMLGYESGELLGKPLATITQEDVTQSAPHMVANVIDQLIKTGEATYEVHHARKDGARIWCRVNTTALEHPELGPVWVGVHEDITESKQMQSKLMLSDRLASVGTLAAGIAHEINNPLAYVMSNLDVLAEEVGALAEVCPPGRLREVEEILTDARQGAERVRKIVRGLRTFSRADDEKRTALDVRAVLELSINMASNEIRHRARLVKDFGPIPLVDADEMRLSQAFINLLVNAAQAIPEGHVDENEIRVVTGTDERGRAVIEVRDTGRGIAPGVTGRIFDPFFTTKAVGVGTGLGLSICHGIVTSLGGEIAVDSHVGKGTTFRISLPGVAEPPPATREKPPTLRPPTVRQGRVLVVDDDPLVGASLRRVLSREHDVTVVTNGKEALEVLLAGSTFDVILCDLMMPHMTGMDLHAELTHKMPEVTDRMVFITGGAFTAAAREFLDTVANQRLEKPFAPQNLRGVVRGFVR